MCARHSGGRWRLDRRTMTTTAMTQPASGISAPISGMVMRIRPILAGGLRAPSGPAWPQSSAMPNSSTMELRSSDSVSSPRDVASTRPLALMNTVVGMPRRP